ncbi:MULTISPECIES: BatD family protein [unclassified Photobacterium]|uniref:BatD family protein n=1 Tax=unclassified Photobacterium TaxID=2628852 RepID=UPI001EE009A9|nr:MULTISPECIES: BatD family protein [unclassified Photobacterium]MCG3865594.1 protein BatD [Photobacterium sp. Ph6]MCG3877095.1 protein BatD [Photobacterium sp. Ph5]
MNKLFFGKKVTTPLLYIALFFSALLSTQAMAAQAEATVSKNIVGVNEVFQLTVAVDDSVNTNSLDLAPLSPDFAYGRPSVSSGTSMINGVISRNTSWTVALAATKVGTLTIPAFQIGSSKTEPITITVLKSSKQKQAANANQSSISIEGINDKSTIYVGESINYRVRILIGEQMDQASLAPPYGDGLTATQVGQDAQNEVVQNGRRYIVITRNYQITADKPGNITLHGAKFSGSVIKGSRGFGSTLTVPVDKTAKNIELTIKAKPSNYKGLWLPTSDLQLNQVWQPSVNGKKTVDAKVGEPITRILTLRIKNIAQSNMPNISLTYPTSVRSYDEKPEYSEGNGYTTMTLKQVIIPRETGTIELPAVSINWWNTQQEKQQTTKVDGLTLNVTVDPNASSTITPPALTAPSVVTPPNNANVNNAHSNVAQHDYWQWATAVFALLWLITLGLLIKARKAQPTSNNEIVLQSGTTNVEQALKQAITKREAVQIQTYYQQWKQQQHEKLSANPELAEKLDNAVAEIMASTYSQDRQQWNDKRIMQLLDQAQQLKATAARASSLSDLDPK